MAENGAGAVLHAANAFLVLTDCREEVRRRYLHHYGLAVLCDPYGN